jgi:predicted ribosomally synthesized peptide with SipW-like signal peptide
MSSDNNSMELSRRKILASVGAVGAAGAGVGIGTSALFSDTESFVNNSITAGELDLLVDWEEHYSYPQLYSGFDDPTTTTNDDDDTVELDVVREAPSAPSGYVKLPDPENPVVWANDEDAPLSADGDSRSSFEIYFGNTIIDAFPSTPGADPSADFDEDGSGNVTAPCEMLANVPGDLGTYNDDQTPGGVNRSARPRNEDTFNDETDEPRPLISLDDVKPGDYGEVTLSTHLCDNDGYLWLKMPGGLTENENGHEEPEPETGAPDGDGQLAENVQTALWYDDNCSNTIDGEPEPIIAMNLIDTSGSLEEADMDNVARASNLLVEELNDRSDTDVEAGLMTFSDSDAGVGNNEIALQQDVAPVEPGGPYLDSSGNGKFEEDSANRGEDTLLPSSGNGQTPVAPALDAAREVLNDRAEASSLNNPRKTIIIISDGSPTSPSPGERYDVVYGSDGNNFNGDSVTSGDPVEAITANAEPQDYSAGDDIVTDIFDGEPNNNGTTTPLEDEAALVARDIDGAEYSDDLDSQPPGPKDDEDQFSDDDGISGVNDINIRTVAVDTDGSPPTDFLMRVATNTSTFGALFYDTDLTGLTDLVDDIVTQLNVEGETAEEVIFRGTLADLESELTTALPLDGDRSSGDFDELNADPSAGPSDDRNCFNADATHCFGFAWWVPIDVGNVIQGDSVAFDLQFLAEQCRNNDDPGQTVL